MTAILLIAACAVTCAADGFTAIWQWADDAPADVLARLRVRADPLTGIGRPPSERTTRRALTLIDPAALQAAARWFTTVARAAPLAPARPPVVEREQRRAERTGPGRPRTRRTLAFDGKALRGARRPGRNKRVNLLGTADRTDGTMDTQRQIAAKTNETPELRAMIKGKDLTDALVAADALHCQHATAMAIIAAGGDYLFIVKANEHNSFQ